MARTALLVILCAMSCILASALLTVPPLKCASLSPSLAPSLPPSLTRSSLAPSRAHRPSSVAPSLPRSLTSPLASPQLSLSLSRSVHASFHLSVARYHPQRSSFLYSRSIPPSQYRFIPPPSSCSLPPHPPLAPSTQPSILPRSFNALSLPASRCPTECTLCVCLASCTEYCVGPSHAWH